MALYLRLCKGQRPAHPAFFLPQPPTASQSDNGLPAMEEEPVRVTWGSLDCRLDDIWPMTVSMVSTRPSVMALSCKQHRHETLRTTTLSIT